MTADFEDSGLDEFQKLLEKYSKNMSEEKVLDAIENTAEQLAKDVRALPKPRSQLVSGGYTHLLDTVTSRRKDKEVEVGWGKYYGPMVEGGTTKMGSQPHLVPTWNRNKDKYINDLQEKLYK